MYLPVWMERGCSAWRIFLWDLDLMLILMPLSLHLDQCEGPVRLFSCSLFSKDANQQLKVTHMTEAKMIPSYYYEPPQYSTFFFFFCLLLRYFFFYTNAAATPTTLKLLLIVKKVYLALCLQPIAKYAVFVSASVCKLPRCQWQLLVSQRGESNFPSCGRNEQNNCIKLEV